MSDENDLSKDVAKILEKEKAEAVILIVANDERTTVFMQGYVNKYRSQLYMRADNIKQTLMDMDSKKVVGQHISFTDKKPSEEIH